ncbi:MgtC/SapB family protein [Actinomycetaceae bacterium TAE3-ERU4]|nr:MgtC/SapB family protein [Actinomycetaceae bacterium TAE3-ERU4]
MSAFFISDTLEIQFVAITAAFVLCSLLGIERHFHQKNAGVKTHVLVGIGACIFTLISAYGFGPALALGASVHLDPSRIAAQIVSGIGFLGAGVIFVNNDTVRGLTTAATVWLSAALGMACGAGMIPLAIFALALHYFLVFAIGPLANKLPFSSRNYRTVIEYESGTGAMRKVMVLASSQGYKAIVTSTNPIKTETGEGMRVVMKFEGPSPQDELISSLSHVPGVLAVDVVSRDQLD